MKETLTFTLAIAAAAMVALYAAQSRKTAAQKQQLASMQAKLEQQAQQTEAARAAQVESEQERNELVRLAAAKSPSNSADRVAFTTEAEAPATAKEPAGSEQNDLGKFFSKMLNDPEAKKFIRDQQRLMMDQMYGPLIKQMGLTPEEGEKFKDLLADTAMNATEKAGSLFGGGSSNRTELLAQMAQDQKAVEQQLKTFLGDTRFAQYQDYQQTVGERVQLNLFKQQMAGSENALTDQQTEQLLGIMREEKQNLAARTGQAVPSGVDQAENLQAMLSDEQANRLFDAQDTINQRVYERAGQFLSPDQLAGFAKFQTNQIQMLRMGVSMARKMMGAGQ